MSLPVNLLSSLSGSWRWPGDLMIGLSIVCLMVMPLAVLWWQGGRARRRGLRVQKRGKAGEAQAVELLSRAGYQVVEAQHGGAFAVEADGKLRHYALRADFLVRRRRDGRLYIAEVKTGMLAPRLRHGPTRRQLLEYTLAYRDKVAGVLLVAPELDRVTCVRFPVVDPILGGLGGLGGRRRWLLRGLLAGLCFALGGVALDLYLSQGGAPIHIARRVTIWLRGR